MLSNLNVIKHNIDYIFAVFYDKNSLHFRPNPFATNYLQSVAIGLNCGQSLQIMCLRGTKSGVKSEITENSEIILSYSGRSVANKTNPFILEIILAVKIIVKNSV